MAECVESKKEKQEKAAKKAADKGETYTAHILRDQAYIAKGLSRILGGDGSQRSVQVVPLGGWLEPDALKLYPIRFRHLIAVRVTPPARN